MEDTLWFYGPWFHILTAFVQSLNLAEHWTTRHLLTFLLGLAALAALLPMARLAGHGDRLGAILVSIDLSILGADRPRYEAYAAAIRKEYAHVPDEAYRSGRSDVLRRFVARPVIYPDAAFAETYDRRARDNIDWELARLG